MLSTVLYVVFGAALIGLIARWVATHNNAWAMPTAWVIWGAAMVKGGVPGWIGWALLALTVVGLLASIKSREWFIGVAMAMLVLAVVAAGFAFAGTIFHKDSSSEPESQQVVDESQDTSTTPAVQAVIDDLHENGWDDDDYVLNEQVDPTLDKSTAGRGSFCDKPIRDVPEMLEFLGSGTVRANALLDKILSQSGGTKAEVFDSNNWVIVQSLVQFEYRGNTMISAGRVVEAGEREGEAGEIFFGFYSPSSGKVVFVRGACANAQVYTPVPIIPTDNGDGDEDDDGLKPKSSNPADYKQPGDGNERDSGTGTRPPSKVTTPAEATPPAVVTEKPGGGGVIDTPTNPPASESGVTAPGATEPEPADEPVPETEGGLNPDDDSGNSGEPGLPAGF